MREIGLASAAEGAVGDDARLGVGGGELLFHGSDAGGTELREQVDRAGADERIGVRQQRGDRGHGGGALGFEADEAGGADVNGRVFQRGDLALGGVEVELGDN